MKKVDYKEMSNQTCKVCGKLLKKNLVNRKGKQTTVCYKHYRTHVQGKPVAHQPRQKRIVAEQPVH